MSQPEARTAGRKLQTIGLVATLAAVVVLVGSLAFGLDGTGTAAPVVPAEGGTGEVPEPAADRIRVEVLNASGRSGLAKQATRFLRDRGFDVVYFGNAGSRAGSASEVIDRVGRGDAADDVAEALGITKVSAQADSTLAVDATVILGTDWRAEGEAADSASEALPADTTRAVP